MNENIAGAEISDPEADRILAAAARTFMRQWEGDTWADLMVHLSCTEAQQVVALYLAAGDSKGAEDIIGYHREQDEEDGEECGQLSKKGDGNG